MSSSDNFQLPSVIAAHVLPDPLESLHSPQHQETFLDRRSRRSSLAADFNDIALDDDNFSPVALTARPNSEHTEKYDENDVVSPRPLSQASSTLKSHKKTASTTTIRSLREQPGTVFTARDTPGQASRARGSVDGQLKLKEEFARLQEQDSKDHTAVDNTIDWDFWGIVISDYHAFATEKPEELARAIQRGIPSTLRGMMWQHMAASKDPELEATYLRLLKETSTHEKAITRDLGRTFPHHDYFTDGQGIGQENLFNVLKAYSLYDPHVGYCQGLPFIVAILLLNFDRLVEDLLPVLHVHFLRQGVKSSMYCSQWFLTLFSYRFPLELVFRIYDSCLANGIEAIFGFSITLLKKNEEALLSLKFDGILAFLNNKLLDCYLLEENTPETSANPRYKVDDFVDDAASLRITPFMLDCYRHEYEDLMRETNKHKLQMDELRNNNRSLTNQIKNLENSLAQLNTEHVEVLNELVKQRLRNEEMEEELLLTDRTPDMLKLCIRMQMRKVQIEYRLRK
ncbi:hypothetical protein CVT24_009414 [Panaeolus cyanescens]|uniref:Rab-GAP TBC domain-containing protein n=1 Tax=Panaeolus cyanescens TaxID=181874 RepID=A0A409VDJ4_9AGAR|nr:hypothetical protein CVT24_009414 [Panaeolus cyanescens]